jgi:hypothetical protein
MMLYIAKSVISSQSSEKMMAPSPFHTNLRRHGFKLEETSSSPNCNQAKRQDDILPYIYLNRRADSPSQMQSPH